MIRKLLIVCAIISIVTIHAQDIDDDKIDEAYIDKELHALIYGADCNDSAQITPRSISPKSMINAKDNSAINSAKYTDSKSRAIAFGSNILRGGIFESQNTYRSDN